jgi:hypothetical protein
MLLILAEWNLFKKAIFEIYCTIFDERCPAMFFYNLKRFNRIRRLKHTDFGGFTQKFKRSVTV